MCYNKHVVVVMFINLMSFLNNLSFIDYVFFFTVIFLIILVVSLIYFIRINDNDLKSEEVLNDPDNLQMIAATIKKESKPITFTSYEQEQEEKAIISYDELLSNTGEYQLNYVDDEEKKTDNIAIKKFDLNNLITPTEKSETIPKVEIHLISLKKEEEFLQMLKELQKSLN